MDWNKDRPFQALALTGGGYRGLFTARALQAIEDHLGEPIGRRFDLTCGTSIGGIIALAVAFEIPMSKVVCEFEASGTTIFPPKEKPTNWIGKAQDFWAHRNRARYQSENLRAVVARILGSDTTLNDALHAVAIPAVNVTKGQPQLFKTRYKREWTRDSKYKAVDVALATSAAPTFFELAEVDGHLYADGGLFANAPDLLATHEAEHFLGVEPGAIRLLSVGTTTKNYSVSFGAGRNFGIQDWMQDQRLFSVTIASQQQLVDQLMKHKLGPNYLRVDAEPSHEQAKDLGLDVATDAAKRTLIALATKSISDVLGSSLQEYLKHEPQLKLFKEG
ncbi:CBASS cGAMP-activated phospholipase [Aquabacterium sp.]|uniref:CBASS cGAMP-activated phospholipase n=1 Tax=Aquabacterium sp. TaxID=1872578 RepID=UPI002488A421|nr:CBASS cGAMP-activated phospholipase [Aquabacterium sp.]MDI1258268.1 CBASS cGAMP-activated phospholipase [Aquabacterium sp.]